MLKKVLMILLQFNRMIRLIVYDCLYITCVSETPNNLNLVTNLNQNNHLLE